jgi:hypothetical protein
MGQAEPTGGLGLTVQHRQVDPARVYHGRVPWRSCRAPETAPGQVRRRPTPAREDDRVADLATVTDDVPLATDAPWSALVAATPPRSVPLLRNQSAILVPSREHSASCACATCALAIVSGNAALGRRDLQGSVGPNSPGDERATAGVRCRGDLSHQLDRNYIDRARLADFWRRPREPAGCQRRRSRSSR